MTGGGEERLTLDDDEGEEAGEGNADARGCGEGGQCAGGPVGIEEVRNYADLFQIFISYSQFFFKKKE